MTARGQPRPFLGVLMLDTAFPRIPGDGGNPASYAFPVRIAVVAGADVPLIVRAGPPPAELVEAFCREAEALERAGAVGIVTTCGFLVHAQAALAARVGVPVMASALSLGPVLRGALGGRPLGVLTADARALGPEALAAAGLAPGDIHVAGLEDAAAWRRLILAPKAGQAAGFDPREIEALAVERALLLARAEPHPGAILLECTNLPPYAPAIRAATGLAVWSILDAAALLWQGAAG